MNRFQKKYQDEALPKLKEKFGYDNNLAVPRIEKVTLNIGTSKAIQDKTYLDVMKDTLRRIGGQNPVETKSRKAISGFGIRDGQIVGLKVTLRKERMYSFLDKFVNISLPRVKDFRGLPEKSVDQNGNLSIGIKEHIAFPEIDSDEVEKLHGLEVNITAKADQRESAVELYRLLGFPFKDNNE